MDCSDPVVSLMGAGSTLAKHRNNSYLGMEYSILRKKLLEIIYTLYIVSLPSFENVGGGTREQSTVAD